MNNEKLKNKMEKWLNVLNTCGEAIEELADRYPCDWQRNLNRYNNVIEDMYNTLQQIKGE